MANTDLVRNTVAEGVGLEVRQDDGLSWYRDDYEDAIYAYVRPRLPWRRQMFRSNVALIRDRPELLDLYRTEMQRTARALRGEALATWLTDDALGVDVGQASARVVSVATTAGTITVGNPHPALVVDALVDLLMRWAGGDKELAERVSVRLAERAARG